MTNPHLLDRADRVGRDPHRKLGWDDRLVGTMRTALGQGVTPRRYAIGAAAAAAVLDRPRWESEQPLADILRPLWAGAAGQDELINLIEEGRSILKRWRAAGFPDLERFVRSG
jgi:mannitol-1-phosphate 5-dehydrogenase